MFCGAFVWSGSRFAFLRKPVIIGINKIKNIFQAFSFKKNIPNNIKTILDNAESIQLLQKYKISFERIRNLSPSKIPSITPETINDKRDLNTFILNEIIQSLRSKFKKKILTISF